MAATDRDRALSQGVIPTYVLSSLGNRATTLLSGDGAFLGERLSRLGERGVGVRQDVV
jgi:hypothetical protein